MYKYPRTPHLPWSPGATSDDMTLHSIQHFVGKLVVITTKMDGECTTLYRDGLHARSLDYSPHPSRSWIRAFHASMCADIPEGMRICGENLYARHSIYYKDLASYFLAFSVWDEDNVALSWDETVEMCALLGIETVPVLYRGLWDKGVLHTLPLEGEEGYVVRLESGFAYEDFPRSVAKYVRKNHVSTDSHWMHGAVYPNGLRPELVDAAPLVRV